MTHGRVTAPQMGTKVQKGLLMWVMTHYKPEVISWDSQKIPTYIHAYIHTYIHKIFNKRFVKPQPIQ